MPPSGQPFRLGPSDALRYERLRRRMLCDAPWAFGATPETDVLLDGDQLERALTAEFSATFGIEARGMPGGGFRRDLVAAAGIYRLPGPKFAHRAHLWGVFVEPGHRGRGAGRAVVTAALDLARSWKGVDFVDLGVSANAPEAYRLYECLGFRAWGREPETTAIDGCRYDEIYMTLRL